MSLIYRAISFDNKVAELLVEDKDCVVCILIDNILKTESKVQCRTLRQAERLVEQFLSRKNYYRNQ